MKLIEDLEPDLVFLDVQMPGLDGMGVIRKLREKDFPLPYFVMATAYDQYAVEAFRWEALDYLLKPVERERDDRPKGLNVLGTLAHYPALTRAYHTFNGHVQFATTLSTRQRELLVLRVASLRQCAYEWAQHAVLAGDVGLSAEEIERVAAGPDAAGVVGPRALDARRRRRAPRRRHGVRRHLGRARGGARRATADGPRLHRRRLRGAGDGAAVLRRRTRRGSSTLSGKTETKLSPVIGRFANFIH